MADESVPSAEDEKSLREEAVDSERENARDDIGSLETRIAELEQSLTQFKDQLLRKAAEFENYKRRTESDYSAMVRFSTEEMIVRLLPILDDFERSMKSGRPAEGTLDDASFYRGIEMIYAKFRKLLETHGVKEMEVLGKPFDPELHDALLQVPNSDVAPHTILEVVDKGYTLHDKVVRHARVIVSADQVSELPSDDVLGVA